MDNINTRLPTWWPLVFAVVVVLLVLYMYTRPTWTQVRIGSRNWAVSGGYSNSRDAAALMAETNATIVEYLRILKRKYHIDEDADQVRAEGDEHARIVRQELHRMASHLLVNYNPDKLYENDPRYSVDTSYTVNKGKAMYLCLRNRSTPDQLVDRNTLVFVALHECAHIANYGGWGHDVYYWSVFKWLLEEAVAAGLYKPVDYRATPVTFCGLVIEYQPLYDPGLVSAAQLRSREH